MQYNCRDLIRTSLYVTAASHIVCICHIHTADVWLISFSRCFQVTPTTINARYGARPIIMRQVVNKLKLAQVWQHCEPRDSRTAFVCELKAIINMWSSLFRVDKEGIGSGSRFTKLGWTLPLVVNALLVIIEIRFALFSFIVECILLLSG